MSAAAVAPLPSAGVERLRVLQVIGALYFGGAERVAANIAIGIDGDRFDMAVCCTRGLGPLAERVTAAGVPVAVAGPQTRLHRYLTPWHVRKAIRRFRPHVVHTHGLPGLAEIGPLACLRQVPRWVHTFHFGNYPYQNTRHMAMERLFGRAADRLIAVSENQRASLAKHHGFALDSILTIPNGIVDVGCRETANSLAAKRGRAVGAERHQLPAQGGDPHTQSHARRTICHRRWWSTRAATPCRVCGARSGRRRAVYRMACGRP
jgi:hypothetical protein